MVTGFGELGDLSTKFGGVEEDEQTDMKFIAF
jgi:hypothetical protein